MVSCATSLISEDSALCYSCPHSPKTRTVGICPSKGYFNSPLLTGQVNQSAALRCVRDFR